MCRDVLVTDQGTLDRGRASLFIDALWMPVWVFSTWLLKAKETRRFLD